MSSIRVRVPFGKESIEVEIPRRNFAGVIKPRDLPAVPDGREAIKQALARPAGCRRLSKIARRGDKVAIVATDLTRRCPEHIIVPAILSELREAGVRREDITVVIALGMHRPMTKAEIARRFGRDVAELVEVVNHSQQPESLVYMGKSSCLKAPLHLNRAVVEADVKVTTGVVEAHVIAGYSGGGKSILPGVSGLETIAATHRPELLDHPSVKLCETGSNPVYRDIAEAAQKTGVDFTVNVVLNSQDDVVDVAAGSFMEVHRKLIETYSRIYVASIREPADIVISAPGYPKDINLYQATRAANNFILTSRPAVRRGGVIIIPAKCQDGVGSKTFYEQMRNRSPQEVLDDLRKSQALGAHKPYIMAKILAHAHVIIAGSEIPESTLREMNMIPARDLQEALEKALQIVGGDARVYVAPHGFSTVPTVEGQRS